MEHDSFLFPLYLKMIAFCLLSKYKILIKIAENWQRGFQDPFSFLLNFFYSGNLILPLSKILFFFLFFCSFIWCCLNPSLVKTLSLLLPANFQRELTKSFSFTKQKNANRSLPSMQKMCKKKQKKLLIRLYFYPFL